MSLRVVYDTWQDGIRAIVTQWNSFFRGDVLLPEHEGTGTRDGTKFLRDDGTWQNVSGATGGTVVSVGLTMPAEFSVSGSPVTSTGTLAVTKSTESANTVWAGPVSGSAAVPTFRALVAADLPGGIGSGTVTSVGLSDGSTVPIYGITGSPVTTTGTLTFTLATQTANKVFAGPASGSAAQPTFRALVVDDVPMDIGLMIGISRCLY